MIDYILVILVSLTTGSFLGSLIARTPSQLSILGRRSICPKCQTNLSWAELVPIVSYIALGGRCKACNAKISLHYPSVESTTLVLFLFLYHRYGLGLDFLKGVVLGSSMIPLMWIDWKYLIIPNRLLLATVVLWILATALSGMEVLLRGVISGLVIGGLFTVIALGGKVLFGRTVLGLGDVKLSAVLGLFLGWELSLMNLWLAALLAMLYGFTRIILESRSIPGMKLAFGSFLGGSAVLVFSFKEEILWTFQRWMLQR